MSNIIPGPIVQTGKRRGEFAASFLAAAGAAGLCYVAALAIRSTVTWPRLSIWR